MKRTLLLLSLACITATAGYAQRKNAQQDEIKTFEEAITRTVEPEVKVYIRPKVADLQMIETERQYYGPYSYKIKAGNLSEWELANFKASALYRATNEADADVMVATIFNSYISENNTRELVIKISGFPAKYVNFRDLGSSPSDMDMVKWVYPAAYSPYAKNAEQERNTEVIDNVK